MIGDRTRFTCVCQWSVASSEAAYPALEMRHHLLETHRVDDADNSHVWAMWVTEATDHSDPHPVASVRHVDARPTMHLVRRYWPALAVIAALVWWLWPDQPLATPPAYAVAEQVAARDWYMYCRDLADSPCVRLTDVQVKEGPKTLPAYSDGSGTAQGFCFWIRFSFTPSGGSGRWTDSPNRAVQCASFRFTGGDPE